MFPERCIGKYLTVLRAEDFGMASWYAVLYYKDLKRANSSVTNYRSVSKRINKRMFTLKASIVSSTCSKVRNSQIKENRVQRDWRGHLKLIKIPSQGPMSVLTCWKTSR